MTDLATTVQPATPAAPAVVPAVVFAGVDTHKDTHHAAAVDDAGRRVADAAFPASRAGYAALLDWLRGLGEPAAAGVEGTSSYGAGLARYLRSQHIRVMEVNRPDRATRYRHGKSDPLDAYAAAEAARTGRATGTPKTADGGVEALRALRTARDGAVKSRTAAINTLKNLIVTSPDDQLRDTLTRMNAPAIISYCATLHPGPDTPLASPATALQQALASIAGRIQALNTEIRALDTHLDALTRKLAPATRAVYGAGTHTATQLLITAGDNPHRLHSEAALAALTGTSPIPASSGRTHRHRLNRGGDRQANKALHQIIIVRLRHHTPTRDYMHKRTQQGLTKKDIIRCLKRYLTREIYRAIQTDLAPKPLDTQ